MSSDVARRSSRASAHVGVFGENRIVVGTVALDRRTGHRRSAGSPTLPTTTSALRRSQRISRPAIYQRP